jgi:hypothetical protein
MSSSTGPTSTAQTGTTLQTRLANIPAQFIQKACQSLARNILPEEDDDQIKKSLYIVWAIVQCVLEQDLDLKDHLADEGEFLDNIKKSLGGEQDFIKSLRGMAKDNSWECLLEDGTLFSSFGSNHPDHVLCPDVFIKPLSTRSLILAAKRAWISPFRGNAHLVLLETIADLLDRDRSPYARLTNIMNSSGTGKSRMVDELGKKIITVPMRLRSGCTEGLYPAYSFWRA